MAEGPDAHQDPFKSAHSQKSGDMEMNIKFAALILSIVSMNAIAAPPVYVCSTRYTAKLSVADTTGSAGSIIFTTTTGPKCTGSLPSQRIVCSVGATYPDCARTNLSEAGLLQLNSSLAATAANGSHIELILDLCNGSAAFTCLAGIGFRGD
jgi:hypothetical protein